MMKTCVFVIAAAGCGVDDIDLNLDHLGVSLDVYDDGDRVRVLGCSDSAFLGCNPEPADARMVVTVDGAQFDAVPGPSEPELPDEIMSLFSSGNLRVTAPAPASGVVGIDLADTAVDVRLPPRFAVDAPAVAVRGTGPITVTYDVAPDATSQMAIVSTTCGNQQGDDWIEIKTPGEVAIDLARSSVAGASCTHEIRIDQARPVHGARVISIGKASLASDP